MWYVRIKIEANETPTSSTVSVRRRENRKNSRLVSVAGSNGLDCVIETTMAVAGGTKDRVRHCRLSRLKPLRTHATPVAQPAGHDDSLPEIPRYIAHFPNDKSKQQSDNDVGDG